MPSPFFCSAMCTSTDLRRAESECLDILKARLQDHVPDLLLFFVTPHHAEAFEGMAERLAAGSGARTVAGCTGASVVGDGREAEGQPALSLWAGCMPGTQVRATHITASIDSDQCFSFESEVQLDDPTGAGLILLADPFSFPVHAYLPLAHCQLPGTTVVGGLASGGSKPGEHRLWLNHDTYDRGALAIGLEGAVRLESVVSQGCRPVGEPQVITSCDGNLIRGLRGQEATKFLFSMMEQMTEEDRSLFQSGAHIGLAIDSTRSSYACGDLLVRNIMGIHPQEGAIAVADHSLRVGQTVQFMVRDAMSASDELSRLLGERASTWSPSPPEGVGALLFTCGGRGTRLFGSENHDAGALQEHMGPDLPLAGFFANGEIGPVRGRSFLHGFTAGIALLRSRD